MAGELFAFLAVFTFVVSNVIFRQTEHKVTPVFINFIRTGIGTLTFIILAIVFNVFFHIFLVPWNLWFLLVLSFVCGQVIGDTSYFTAQRELGTTKALAVSMTFPLFTFIISMLFLNRPFDYRVIISIILIGTGVIIISKYKIKSVNSDISAKDQVSVSNDMNNTNNNSQLLTSATIFGIIASLFWSIGLVLIDYAINEIDQIIQLESSSSLIGNVIRFPFVLLILLTMVWREAHFKGESKSTQYKKLSAKIWGWLIIASIIGTSLGAYFYAEAARTAGATLMALIASACPLFALPLDYFINGEKITKKGFIGIILTILGVIVIVI